MATARPFLDVARDPWRVTLYTFAMLRDYEQITQRIAGVSDARAAHRMAVAWHDPKRLPQMEQHALAALMSHRVTDHAYVKAKREALELAAQRDGVEVQDLGS